MKRIGSIKKTKPDPDPHEISWIRNLAEERKVGTAYRYVLYCPLPDRQTTIKKFADDTGNLADQSVRIWTAWLDTVVAVLQILTLKSGG